MEFIGHFPHTLFINTVNPFINFQDGLLLNFTSSSSHPLLLLLIIPRPSNFAGIFLHFLIHQFQFIRIYGRPKHRPKPSSIRYPTIFVHCPGIFIFFLLPRMGQFFGKWLHPTSPKIYKIIPLLMNNLPNGFLPSGNASLIGNCIQQFWQPFA